MGDKNISKDYLKLFILREGKVVLGHKFSHLWVLCCVLVATFLAIGFSNASLTYLKDKMDDPFINWVDIKNNYAENEFDLFQSVLENDDDLKVKYHFKGVQTDKYWYTLFFTAANDTRNLKCRYFEDIRTSLVEKILEEDNVVDNYCVPFNVLTNESFGVIITQDALINKLGYKQIPEYINYSAYCDPEAGDEMGVEIFEEHRAKVPMPILAVVKRLPTNMDIISTKYSYQQSLSYTFNLYNWDYASSLLYYAPNQMIADKLCNALKQMANERIPDLCEVTTNRNFPRITGFGKGKFVYLSYNYEDDIDYLSNIEMNSEILSAFAKDGIFRVYDYEDNETLNDANDYMSVYFGDLDKIREFQEFAKNEYKIDIEMSQINAKENFNEVSIMANILSWTMIVFAIVCIILFIINLFQSYFQKVKRNLGTFKAFGMSNRHLVMVYVLIMAVIIVCAVIASLLASLLIQWTLPLFDILKDGKFNYINLESIKTLVSVLIILIASVVTVNIVMKKLLRTTPGNLIYDR